MRAIRDMGVAHNENASYTQKKKKKKKKRRRKKEKEKKTSRGTHTSRIQKRGVHTSVGTREKRMREPGARAREDNDNVY